MENNIKFYCLWIVIVCLICSSAFAIEVKLGWTDTKNTGHDGYILYYGQTSHAGVAEPSQIDATPYEFLVEVADPAARELTIDVGPGVWYFRMSVYQGTVRTTFSNEIGMRIDYQPVDDLRMVE